MAFTRRSFIRIIGSSAVIAAAGTGYFAATRTPTEALEPWKLAGTGYTDPRMRALSYAILAPNPHNRQPWMVDLGTENEAILYCDLERLLPETDPFDRQITIGLGCFLELLRMAAAAEGLVAEITPFPEGLPELRLDGRPVAHIRFVPSDEVLLDPLFAHVLQRVTNKEPYDTSRTVTDEVLGALLSASDDAVSVRATNVSEDLSMYRSLTWKAHLIEMTTPRTNQESVDLMRIGKDEINANPDGIDIGGFMLEGMNLAGLVTRETLADPNSTGFKQGLEMFKGIMASAMGYVWVKTEANSRLDQLNSGSAWVRLNLQATALGLGIHPLSQALQEYVEMKSLYEELHESLGAIGTQRVQMFGRLGYGPSVAPKPRWKIETRVIGQ